MTVFVDTSVWVEFLRATGSPADDFLQRSLGRDPLAWSGPVLMELVAGAPRDNVDRVVRMVTAQQHAVIEPVEDFLWAGDAYQRARRAGRTIRSLTDCLIAAVCVRKELVVAHRDADFEELARATDLATLDLR